VGVCVFGTGSGGHRVRVPDTAAPSLELAHLHSLRYFNLFHCAFHIIVFAILIAVASGAAGSGGVRGQMQKSV